MYAPDGKYVDALPEKSTLEAIQGLNVDAVEAVRLLTLYCGGENAPKEGRLTRDSSVNPNVRDTPECQSTVTKVMARLSFEDVIAGEFTI